MVTARRQGFSALAACAGLIVVGLGVAVVAEVPTRLLPEFTGAVTWGARILLALTAAWVLIGMIATRTALVRRPGAAAARATWLGSTRPWRVRESTLGMFPLDRSLLLIVPVGLLIVTRVLAAATLPMGIVLAEVVGVLVFTLVLRLYVGARSPWPLIAAIGGVVVFRSVPPLIALAIGGPHGLELMLTADPGRAFYLAVAVGTALWLPIVAAWALTSQFGAPRAVGATMVAFGAAVLVAGIASALAGQAAAGAFAGLVPVATGLVVLSRARSGH